MTKPGVFSGETSLLGVADATPDATMFLGGRPPEGVGAPTGLQFCFTAALCDGRAASVFFSRDLLRVRAAAKQWITGNSDVFHVALHSPRTRRPQTSDIDGELPERDLVVVEKFDFDVDVKTSKPIEAPKLGGAPSILHTPTLGRAHHLGRAGYRLAVQLYPSMLDVEGTWPFEDGGFHLFVRGGETYGIWFPHRW